MESVMCLLCTACSLHSTVGVRHIRGGGGGGDLKLFLVQAFSSVEDVVVAAAVVSH